jgi:integrase
VDLTRYDRSPVLSATEWAVLERVLGSPHGQLRSRSRLELHRLVQPLDDVLDRFIIRADERTGAVRVLLWEMYRRQTTFWVWSPEEWRDTVTPSLVAFDRRYGWAGSCHNSARSSIPLLAYLLGGVAPDGALGRAIQLQPLACKVFGVEAVATAGQRLSTVLEGWGYSAKPDPVFVAAISYLLLRNRSPYLEDLNSELLEAVAAQGVGLPCVEAHLLRISLALADLNLIARPLPDKRSQGTVISGTDGSVEAEWLAWCRRWRDHSTLRTRDGMYYVLLKIGRWLQQCHLEVTSPAHWTYELAAEFVAVVDRMTIGDWADAHCRLRQPERLGQPLSANAKARQLGALRTFLHDCQEWGWITAQLNPFRSLRTPPSIRRLLGPDPQVIDQALWAKLVWAALNLTTDDLVWYKGQTAYPLEMVAAVAVVWCFSALRSDEIMRLRVGCVRRARGDMAVPGTDEILPKDAVCFLDVPVSKSMTAYSKPVHPLVGQRIAAWEQIRPAAQRLALDPKTGERVHYLFAFREQRMSRYYINDTLIPLLCRKAGIPEHDSRGRVTSHRARATIASLLYNAPEPLSIYELMQYLGHKEISSTQYYVKIDATKLASDVAKANYLEQNLATVSVLLDQEAVLSGAAARGEAWKYYDLGHGFCTNAFWAQCAHRMACARCPFYRPKDSLAEQMVEGKANLVRMLEFVRLTDEERQLVEEGIGLHQALIEKLQDTPTLAGPTPRQLEAGRQGTSVLIPFSAIQGKTGNSL